MDLKAKKSLGQNFLHDEFILKKIANSIETDVEDLVIEIGPGTGALTKYLSEKNSFLVCYEIDERMQEFLKKYENEKTKIIFSDFLKANILEDIKEFNYKNVYVIANIPYYITTPIIKKIISINVKSMSLLVQKEVAQRICAKPGTKAYGSLTVFLNYYFEVDYLFDVKNTCFLPVPKVDSAVVQMERKKQEKLENEELFFKLVNASFQMKRKTLKNNLKEYDWNKILNVLEKNNLNDYVRAEEIPLEVFKEIADVLNK